MHNASLERSSCDTRKTVGVELQGRSSRIVMRLSSGNVSDANTD